MVVKRSLQSAWATAPCGLATMATGSAHETLSPLISAEVVYGDLLQLVVVGDIYSKRASFGTPM